MTAAALECAWLDTALDGLSMGNRRSHPSRSRRTACGLPPGTGITQLSLASASINHVTDLQFSFISARLVTGPMPACPCHAFKIPTSILLILLIVSKNLPSSRLAIQHRYQKLHPTGTMTNTVEILIQAIDQLERLNGALSSLRREFLPGQPRRFAILAEGPLEDMRRLHGEIERLTAQIATAPAAA
jgi:hypothetical protein